MDQHNLNEYFYFVEHVPSFVFCTQPLLINKDTINDIMTTINVLFYDIIINIIIIKINIIN